MKKLVLLLAAAALAFSVSPAMAQKKQLVIVVKGLDNAFFEAINQGCQKWNSENADFGIRMLLHRPGVDRR